MRITIAVLVSLLAAPAVTLAQGARLQLDHLDRLAKLAEEQVNVTIDTEMLKLASGFMKGDGADAAVKEMVAGLPPVGGPFASPVSSLTRISRRGENPLERRTV